jgi:hypothetical protein
VADSADDEAKLNDRGGGLFLDERSGRDEDADRPRRTPFNAADVRRYTSFRAQATRRVAGAVAFTSICTGPFRT